MIEPNRHYSTIRSLFLVLTSLPLVWQLRHFLIPLPPNLFAELAHCFGHTSIILLIMALAITPLRRWLTFGFTQAKIKWGKRLADWNFLIRLRRPIGVCSFLYMVLHIITYLYLELGFSLNEFIYEIQYRKFILPGLLAAIIMTMLALSSPTSTRRKLGRNWRRLHRSMYVLCLLSAFHYLWFAKATEMLPWFYLGLIIIFLMHRILTHSIEKLSCPDDTGMEVNRVGKKPQKNS